MREGVCEREVNLGGREEERERGKLEREDRETGDKFQWNGTGICP